MLVVFSPFIIALLIGIAVFLFTQILLRSHYDIPMRFVRSKVSALSIPFQRVTQSLHHRKHLSALKKELVVVVDLLRLYVSAGQNIEFAVRSTARAVRGAWRRELASMGRELDLGMELATVFRNNAERLGVPEFSRILFALRQAEHLEFL